MKKENLLFLIMLFGCFKANAQLLNDSTNNLLAGLEINTYLNKFGFEVKLIRHKKISYSLKLNPIHYSDPYDVVDWNSRSGSLKLRNKYQIRGLTVKPGISVL